MQIVVLAQDNQWEELMTGTTEHDWIRVNDTDAFLQYPSATMFFNLHDDASSKDYSALTKPVFINSVIYTLKEKGFGENIFRINGWSTFLNRPVWEMVGSTGNVPDTILSQIGKKIYYVADEPGMVAARIVAMIINEAYFALGDDVSSKEEINIAMKLGTNYPYGPFEWAEKIGVQNIYHLLSELTNTDSRYTPAPILIKEST